MNQTEMLMWSVVSGFRLTMCLLGIVRMGHLVGDVDIGAEEPMLAGGVDDYLLARGGC